MSKIVPFLLWHTIKCFLQWHFQLYYLMSSYRNSRPSSMRILWRSCDPNQITLLLGTMAVAFLNSYGSVFALLCVCVCVCMEFVFHENELHFIVLLMAWSVRGVLVECLVYSCAITAEQGVYPSWERIWAQGRFPEPADESVPQCCQTQYNYNSWRWHQEFPIAMYPLKDKTHCITNHKQVHREQRNKTQKQARCDKSLNHRRIEF